MPAAPTMFHGPSDEPDTKILSINIDSREPVLEAVAAHVQLMAPKPLVILLQDIFIIKLDELVDKCAKLFDCTEHQYKLFTNDQLNNIKREQPVKRDTIVLARMDLEPAQLESTTEIPLCSMTGVVINARGKSIPIFSVYIRPGATTPSLKRAMDFMTGHINRNQGLFIGDFNAHSPEWMLPRLSTIEFHEGRNNAPKRGKALSRFIKNAHLVCLNRLEEGPTFVGHQGSSSPDVALATNNSNRVWNKFELSPICIDQSGKVAPHRMLVIGTKINVNCDPPRIIHCPDRLEEGHFVDVKRDAAQLVTCDWKLLSPNQICADMDSLTRKLTRTLRWAMAEKKLQVRTQVANQRFTHHTPRICALLKHLDEARNLRRKVWQDLRTRRAPSRQEAQRQLAEAERKIKSLERTLRRGIDIDATIIQRSLERGRQAGTGTSRAETSIRLLNDSGFVDEEDEEQLGQSSLVYDLLKDKYPDSPRCESSRVCGDMRSKCRVSRSTNFKCSCNRRVDGHKYSCIISDLEVENAIKELDGKHQAGADKIAYGMLAAAYKFIPEIISTICKQSFFIATLPIGCEELLAGTIPKADGKLRIIHVSTGLAHLLETIAAKRLLHALEPLKQGLDPCQYAFTIGRDRLDLISRVIHHTMEFSAKIVRGKGRSMKHAVTRLFKFDIKSAFDSVDHEAFCKKLLRDLKGDPLKYWLTTLVTGRVVVDSATCSRRALNQGFAQGSRLAPILFSMAINGLGRLIRTGTTGFNFEFLIYADDIFLVGHGIPTGFQNQIDKLVAYLNHYGLILNVDKCAYSQFEFGYASKVVKRPFALGTSIIKKAQFSELLGPSFTKKLRVNHVWLNDLAATSLALNARRLFQMNRLLLLRTNSAWRHHIRLYIYNSLTNNLYPALVLDSGLRNEVDLFIARAIRSIFRWSPVCCKKVIRLIFQLPTTHYEVKKWLYGKLASCTDHLETYKALDKLFRGEALACDRIKPLVRFQRRQLYWNPALHLDGPHTVADSGRRLPQKFWLIADGTESSMAMLMDERCKLLERLAGVHIQRRSPYYNSLALLHHLATSEKDPSTRFILFNSGNALLQALTNYESHDWWIIELRQAMIVASWQILVAENDQVAAMRKRGTNCALEHVETMQLEFPDQGDYEATKEREAELKADLVRVLDENHTTVTRAICPDVEVWANISPYELNSKHLIRLAGSVFDTAQDAGDTVEACESGTEIVTPPEVLCDRQACHSRLKGAELVIHRIFDCIRYEGQRREWLRYKDVDARLQMQHTLRSISHRKKFLDFLYQWPQ